jgi:hypothetical protein
MCFHVVVQGSHGPIIFSWEHIPHVRENQCHMCFFFKSNCLMHRSMRTTLWMLVGSPLAPSVFMRCLVPGLSIHLVFTWLLVVCFVLEN